ncbi:MAG: IS1 family transposase [Candidatus Poribacteria bacterium]|nr:IS1 family transposase [Candidatus Poribacteria bacterium]
MSCPRCQHPHFVKNGHINQRQRYKCKDCDYQWIENPIYTGRPLTEKALAVFLYCHGLSMNAIAKMLQASPSTILEWIRNFTGEHTKPAEPQQTDTVVLELDEMWHYLKEKKTNSGFGKLCVVIPENSSLGSVVIGIKRPSKNSSKS